ncbi:MAG: ADOP family duplicated permease [Gemmatimonadaceae bacterium]
MTDNPKFRRLFRFDSDKQSVESEVDDELQFHFDLAVRELMAKGATENDARAEAERRFGDVERTRKGLKEIDRAHVAQSRRAEWLSSIAQDTRYALRGMRRRPGFSIAVVLILALGIGANATMFGIVDRLLLRTPNFLVSPNHVQRVYLATTQSGKVFFGSSASYRRFHELTDSAKTIDLATALWQPELAVGVSNPREMRVTYATASFWKLFSIRPAIGRFYSADEDVPTHSTNVAVLGYGYWQTAYGGSDDAIGQIVRIGRFDYTIIGVAPKDFNGIGNRISVAYIPLSSGADNSFAGNGRNHWYDTYGLNWLQVIVRRKPQATIAEAQKELDGAFLKSYIAQRAQNPGTTLVTTAKPHTLVGSILAERGPNQRSDVKIAVWLVGVALIVLIVACANVSNLMLARALQRKKETALRLALGISRGRLLRQLITESVMLALLGGLAGLALSQWGGGILSATLLPGASGVSSFTDSRTILFTLIIATIAGVLAGVVPSWRAGGMSLASALKTGAREGTYQRSRLRSSLLVIQGALSVVLLVGAGLFVKSLTNVQSLRLGYDADRLAWIEVQMRGVVLDSVAKRALFEEILRSAQNVPVARSASFAAMVPFYSEWEEGLFIAGIDSVSNLGSFLLQSVSSGYFETMGTRIVRGRGISTEDKFGAPRSMVVSQSMARKLWPKTDPIGQCVKVVADTMPCTYVVGIAEDIKYTSLADDPGLQYYVARDQYASGSFLYGGVFVNTKGLATANVEAIRAAVQRVMPGGSYVTVTSLATILDPVRHSWQLGATMFVVFGALALIVASIGLYSVISYTVAQRTQEMGVRVALGAQTRDVIRLVLSQSVSVSLFAIAIGLGVALFAAKWVGPLLFETSARDPVVYGGVAGVLVVVAVAAALIPAVRAARVDPSTALRGD